MHQVRKRSCNSTNRSSSSRICSWRVFQRNEEKRADFNNSRFVFSVCLNPRNRLPFFVLHLLSLPIQPSPPSPPSFERFRMSAACSLRATPLGSSTVASHDLLHERYLQHLPPSSQLISSCRTVDPYFSQPAYSDDYDIVEHDLCAYQNRDPRTRLTQNRYSVHGKRIRIEGAGFGATAAAFISQVPPSATPPHAMFPSPSTCSSARSAASFPPLSTRIFSSLPTRTSIPEWRPFLCSPRLTPPLRIPQAERLRSAPSRRERSELAPRPKGGGAEPAGRGEIVKRRKRGGRKGVIVPAPPEKFSRFCRRSESASALQRFISLTSRAFATSSCRVFPVLLSFLS